MTPKEQAAMQQALEALENAYENGFLTGITGLKTIDIITALREALEQPDEIDWIETNKSLAKEIIELKKQAEQEPVAYVYEKDVAGIGMRKDVAFTKHVEVGTDLYAAPVQQAEQEPIGEVDPYMDFLRINWKDDKHPPRGTKLYAAPIRTKDLTDDEIAKLQHKIDWTAEWSYVNFARDVIAADREKNK